MPITQTPRLKLQKQALGDASWHTGTNEGFDNADLRLLSHGAASPVGVEEGFYIGHLYYQTSTSPPTVWVCTAIGTPGTWIQLSQLMLGGDVLAALVLANTIALRGKESGGTARDLAVMSAANKVLLGAITNLLTLQTSGATALKVDYGSGEQTVWHAGNDGVGSGLDADLLDGLSKADFLSWDVAGGLYFTGSAPLNQSAVVQNFAHGLVTRPRVVQMHLRCVISEGGYPIGEIVPITSSIGNISNIIAIGADATNVWYRAGTITFPLGKTSGLFNITQANWAVDVHAWK